MKISLEKLQQKAATRPPGYYAEVIAAGTIKNGYLYLTQTAHQTLHRKYNPPRLGDRIHAILNPLAKLIDRLFKTNLQNCPHCRRRQRWFNRFSDHLKDTTLSLLFWPWFALTRRPKPSPPPKGASNSNGPLRNSRPNCQPCQKPHP